MGAMASQITSLTIAYSIVLSGRKHQCPASLAFVRVIPRSPGNSPHKWSVAWKMFPFDDVIMVLIKYLILDSSTMGPTCFAMYSQSDCRKIMEPPWSVLDIEHDGPKTLVITPKCGIKCRNGTVDINTNNQY